MERFIFHHPKLYQQSLIVCFFLLLFGGLHSLFAASNEQASSILTPPAPVKSEAPAKRVAAKTTAVKTSLTRPKGWEGVTRLPGRDGSAPVTQVAAPVATSTSTSIPLGNGDMRALGRSLNAVEFGDQHWPALLALWNRESNWNPNAKNPSSGACGIPQALPCSKIPDMSPQGQIEWGLQYIRNRYGTPSNAWSFWLRNNWY